MNWSATCTRETCAKANLLARHMQEISSGHALLHVAAFSGSPRSYRACACPLVLHLSGDAQEMIMRDSATCAREPCARANSLARVDNELKCHLRKGNLRKG